MESLNVLQSMLLAGVYSVCIRLCFSLVLMQSLLICGDPNDLLTESLDVGIMKKERGEVPLPHPPHNPTNLSKPILVVFYTTRCSE